MGLQKCDGTRIKPKTPYDARRRKRRRPDASAFRRDGYVGLRLCGQDAFLRNDAAERWFGSDVVHRTPRSRVGSLAILELVKTAMAMDGDHLAGMRVAMDLLLVKDVPHSTSWCEAVAIIGKYENALATTQFVT